MKKFININVISLYINRFIDINHYLIQNNIENN